jgi:4-diphosphocytidyl-2-C-methyl-D-erythritol kinase
MVLFPNAKINIGLSVIRRRDDGFHDIESVFYPVGLCDALEYLPAGKSAMGTADTIAYSGSFPVTGKDICIKMAGLAREAFSFPPLTLHLHKNIPPGSGLGGGSSDAAFLLKSLNNNFSFGLTQVQLENLAGRAGSDCPFFIRNEPCLVTGRGDKLETIRLSLEGFYLVLVCPGIHISTTEAYGLIKPVQETHGLREKIFKSVEEWKDLIVNQFEEPVFRKHPRLKEIKKELYRMGAAYASMTGSGSAVYGLFRSGIEIRGEFSGCFVHRERLH